MIGNVTLLNVVARVEGVRPEVKHEKKVNRWNGRFDGD